MLTLIEKILFVIATLVSLYFTYRGVARIMDHINSGQGKIDWSLAYKRIGDLIVKVGLFQPVFRFRLGPSILHGLIGWGFLSFLLINLADLIYAFTGFKLLENTGWFGDCIQAACGYCECRDHRGNRGAWSFAASSFDLRLCPRARRLFCIPRHALASCAIRRLLRRLSLSITLMRFLGESFGLALAGHADSLAANHFNSGRLMVRCGCECLWSSGNISHFGYPLAQSSHSFPTSHIQNIFTYSLLR